VRSGDIIEAIGHTPLVEIARMSPKREVRIFAKLEGQNLGGSASVKDRIAKYMIEKGEESGELRPGRIVLEATSGNTGIALAQIGRRKGYKVKVVMPDNVSVERRRLLEIFGAEIVLTEGAKGVNWAIQVAQAMAAEDKRYFIADQFGNPANPLAHYETTGVEILEDLGELNIDALVCGLGTGGTITGAGRRLRERYPDIKLIAVEPPPQDPIQGLRSLAEGFIPPVLDLDLLDKRVVVLPAEATAATAELLKKEGIFAGVSSGAVVHQAIKVAAGMERGGIVVVLPDAGWKYLSLGTDLWIKGRADLKGSELCL